MKHRIEQIIIALLLMPLASLHAADAPKPTVKVTQELLNSIHVTPKLIFDPFPAYAQKYLPFAMAASMEALGRVCLEEAVQWARERKTFGKRLADHQVIRHKIAQMKQKLNATQAYIRICYEAIEAGIANPGDIALLKVHQVYQVCKPHGIPIIGQGGITTAKDAIEFLIAGAAAVGVGTALFYDPLVCSKINSGILDYLQRHRLESVNELTGSLVLHGDHNSPCCG